MNFLMNFQKTPRSDNIVAEVVKPDKTFCIFNSSIFNKKCVDFDGLGKHLYFINECGKKFTNSGQLKNMLSNFTKRLKQKIEEMINIVEKVDLNIDKKPSKSSFFVLTKFKPMHI